MKTTLKISFCLNLILLGGAFFLLMERQKKTAVSAPTTANAEVVVAQTVTRPALSEPPRAEPEPFQWHQLESAKNYRLYVANLRAIGCPEPTIQDIVRGDTARTFAYERRQLGLEKDSSGPWSPANEQKLLVSLLNGEPPGTSTAALAQNTASVVPQVYPLFLQSVNWNALGFDADQQAAIAQVRQQYLDRINSQNQQADNPGNQNSSSPANPSPNNQANSNPSRPTPPASSQSPDDILRGLLGAAGYEAYEQQQYKLWFQPQVAANVGDGNLTITPAAFSVK